MNRRLVLVGLVIDGQSEGHGVTPIDLSTKPGQLHTYVFYSAEILLSVFNQYITATILKHTEYFIAPLYQYAISIDEKVGVCTATATRLYGTPDELLSTFELSRNALLAENAWDAHQRGTLVVDIDGTLCGTAHKGDYSAVDPIEEVCEALKRANEAGFYIVLFTSRNMRTFRGSIGLINKYTAPVLIKWLIANNIPYDEIYFGKPWGPGVQYIDDKGLSIDDFIHAYD